MVSAEEVQQTQPKRKVTGYFLLVLALLVGNFLTTVSHPLRAGCFFPFCYWSVRLHMLVDIFAFIQFGEYVEKAIKPCEKPCMGHIALRNPTTKFASMIRLTLAPRQIERYDFVSVE